MKYLLSTKEPKYSGPDIEKYAVTDRETAFCELRCRAATGLPHRTWVDTSFKAGVLQEAHVMVVDCDSEKAMVTDAHILKAIFGTNYEVVESSENHFWIITDIVGTYDHIVKYFEMLVGVDQHYRFFTKHRKRWHLRLHPKNDCLPLFKEGKLALENPESIKLYNQLREDFEEMKVILEVSKIQQLYAKGRIMDAAANPDFTV